MYWIRVYDQDGKLVDNLPFNDNLDAAIEEGEFQADHGEWFEIYSEDCEERLWNSVQDVNPDEVLFW